MAIGLSTHVLLRDVAAADVPQLARLANALSQAMGDAPLITESALEAALFGADRQVMLQASVAEANGILIGFVLYYPGFDTASCTTGMHIADIYVADGFRGKGTGKRLIAEAMRSCIDREGEWCSLTVLNQNPDAQAFYEALGFVVQPVAFQAIGIKGMQTLLRISKN